MKYVYQLFSFIILTFPGRSQTSLLDSIINKVEAKNLVAYLSADNFQGRFTGTDEAKKAAGFIANEFRIAGAKSVAGFNGYLLPFQVNRFMANSIIGFNVVSVLPGRTKPNEMIIFSAHYDHVGTTSTNPYKQPAPIIVTDNIYNGANDDASGIAAVILLARYFAGQNNNQRTLIFIAFSGEELGLFGSKAFSRQIQPDLVKAVINIEMIGRNRGKQVHPLITGHLFSNLKSILNDALAEYGEGKYDKQFFVNDPFSYEGLFNRSDNWSFAVKGIPAHTIMLTDPHDEFYHSTGDEIQTLDFNAMTLVIRSIALACKNLVKGTATPDRIDTIKIHKQDWLTK